jgi:CRP-like cAMP-binding protein
MAAPDESSPAARVLARTALFGSLDPVALADLARLARPLGFRADEVICRKGDDSRSLYVIERGRVKISTTSADGREVALNLLGPDETWGEVALADGGPRTADATAVEPVRLLAFDRAELVPYLERRPEVTLKMLAALAARLRWVASSLEDSAFLPLPARLAKRLMVLGRHFGFDTAAGRRLTVSLPQRELAAHMGVSREAVNRLLQAWIADGLVAVDRGVIVLTDEARLGALAAAG